MINEFQVRADNHISTYQYFIYKIISFFFFKFLIFQLLLLREIKFKKNEIDYQSQLVCKIC